MKDKPIFYDTDCIVSFLIIGDVFVLHKLFSKAIIPRPVYDELTHESTPSVIKNNLNILIKNNFIEIKEIDIRSKLYTTYKCIEDGFWGNKPIGKGEASAIAFAIENSGIVASNNLSDVKELTEKHNIPLLTTAIILSFAVDNNIIDESKADTMWLKMIKRNIKLPTDSFLDYYLHKYKIDCKNFDIYNYL
ncbi:hypothetical protein LJB96_04365 [Methanobrevibacter sp. OttesenSCG-928-K11]|nr:hypothetical protein [Methanobrevibacter sp. OttesenSCG-928-K11]MDL2270326.1 hypothetical protein [Methanobrevibacter sp. OttesenSCG-928-I08]